MKSSSSIFLNKAGKLRSSLWVAVFFIMLAAIVFAMIILADRFQFQITFWHQALAIALPSLVCQKLSGNRLSGIFGKLDRTWIKQFLTGLLLGALLISVPALLLALLGFVRWTQNTLFPKPILLALWSMAGVVVAEELLFRGFIFQRFIAGFGVWAAQLVIAFLFLLTHLNNPNLNGSIKILATVNIFAASILFGMAYISTRRLAMPLGIHFMANVMQGIVLGFGVSGNHDASVFLPEIERGHVTITGGEFGIEASIFGLATLLALTAGFHMIQIRKKNIHTFKNLEP